MEQLTHVKRDLKKWESAFYLVNGRKPGKGDIEDAPEHVKDSYKKYAQLKRVPEGEAENRAAGSVWGKQLNKDSDKQVVSKTPIFNLSSKSNIALEDVSHEKQLAGSDTSKQSRTKGTSLMAKLGHRLMSKSNLHITQSTQVNGAGRDRDASQLPADDPASQDDPELYSNRIKDHTRSMFEKARKLGTGCRQRAAATLDKSGNGAAGPTKLSGAVVRDDDDVKLSPYIISHKSAKPLKFHMKNYRGFSDGEFDGDLSGDPSSSSSQVGLEETERTARPETRGDIIPASPTATAASSPHRVHDHSKTNHLSSTTACRTSPAAEGDSSENAKFSLAKATNHERGSEVAGRGGYLTTQLGGFNEAINQTSDHGAPSTSEPSDVYSNGSAKADFPTPKARAGRGMARGSGKAPNAAASSSSSSTAAAAAAAASLRSRSRLQAVELKRKRSGSAEAGSPDGAAASDVTWRPESRGCLMVDLDVGHTAPEDEAGREPEENQEETAPAAKKRKTTRGASSKPLCNDNFVRLNMKVKKYQRKGKGSFSGGHHKRMAWKQKMKSRRDNCGDKCFKCGGTGHWANKCKGQSNSGKKETFGDRWEEGAGEEPAQVQEADYPSMQQAAAMARGIKHTPQADKDKVKAAASSVSQPADTASLDDPMSQFSQGFDEVVDQEEVDLDVVRSRPEAPPVPPPHEPLYQLNDDGSLPEPPPEVFTALARFGFESFRPGQQKAVMRILCGESTLVILSTGAGKSLCYQLPAFMYGQRSPCLTLVISPLVSLMEDQVAGLPAGILGCCLHTNMTPGQREKVIAAVMSGQCHFLLVSPEALASGGRRGLLPGSAKLPPIAFACIDEVHCVSEWSHHFRPSYLRICKILRENYGIKCMLGLTATATMTTAASIAQHLGIHDYHKATIRSLPVPSNLYLSVSRDENKDDALMSLLQGDRFSTCQSVIIYCTRRQQTDRIATLIRTCLKDATPTTPFAEPEQAQKRKKGKKAAAERNKPPKGAWDSESYHAGLTAAQRKRVQNAFMAGRLRVVVATVAFGMGLDKSDVRGIVHYNLPKSFESYVQEIGRAGRDGQPAFCHLFLDPKGGDMNELKRHIYSNTVDRYTIKKLVLKVFPRCHCRALHEHQQRAVKECEFEDDGIDYSQLDGGGKPLDATDDWSGGTESQADPAPHRLCAGHERAVPIDTTVRSLDMKEEGVSTLLCYLELHPKRWLENLQSVYATCMLQCYGGPVQLQQISQSCPPVAVAIARARKDGVSFAQLNRLEFNVVEVSDCMGWESGPVKRELKMLPWKVDKASGASQKTGVMVEFSDLAFHLRSPGDLLDEEVDEVVDFLNDRVQAQERTQLAQLAILHQTLKRVSHKEVWMCADHLDEERSEKLRQNLHEYFDQEPELEDGQVTKLSFSRELSSAKTLSSSETEPVCHKLDQVRADIRQFINLYSSEHTFSGRAIARILMGIGSPCFPAEVWGRVRRFWREHLGVDFNLLCKLATQELIRQR